MSNQTSILQWRRGSYSEVALPPQHAVVHRIEKTDRTMNQDRRTFDVQPAAAALGAAVIDCDIRALDPGQFEALHAAWLHHLLLVFPSQHLDAPGLVRFARRFGTPVSSSSFHTWSKEEISAHELLRVPPEISIISNIKEKGKSVGALGDAEVAWHSDFSFKERPTAARMLLAMELPTEGGSTYFLNCHAAYDALPGALKQRISGMTIKQDNTYDTAMQLRPNASPAQDIRLSPGASHPIISTHPETGRNALFLGRRNRAYVNGLSVEESEALLNELWAHSTQERFVYRHDWSLGDVVVWDNRCVLHRRDAFSPDLRRILYAAQVEGHRPYEAPDALTRPSHARATA